MAQMLFFLESSFYFCGYASDNFTLSPHKSMSTNTFSQFIISNLLLLLMDLCNLIGVSRRIVKKIMPHSRNGNLKHFYLMTMSWNF